jgi:hypothetical protein
MMLRYAREEAGPGRRDRPRMAEGVDYDPFNTVGRIGMTRGAIHVATAGVEQLSRKLSTRGPGGLLKAALGGRKAWTMTLERSRGGVHNLPM